MGHKVTFMEDWDADLSPCNFATTHLLAKRKKQFYLPVASWPLVWQVSFCILVGFATHEMEDLFATPQTQTILWHCPGKGWWSRPLFVGPFPWEKGNQRAANGGLDPSWLNLAFLGAPRFSLQRSQNPLKLVFWDLGTENHGAPQNAKFNHDGSNPPFCDPLSKHINKIPRKVPGQSLIIPRLSTEFSRRYWQASAISQRHRCQDDMLMLMLCQHKSLTPPPFLYRVFWPTCPWLRRIGPNLHGPDSRAMARLSPLPQDCFSTN